MDVRFRRSAIVAILILWAAGCAAPPPQDTAESRAAGARAVARIALEGGALDDTLDLGASLALEQASSELAIEIGRDLTAEEEVRVEAVIRSALAEIVTRERFEDAMATVYAVHFSAAELADIAAFFETPTGRKALSVQAAVSSEIGDATEAILEEQIGAFIADLDARLEAEFPGLASGDAP